MHKVIDKQYTFVLFSPVFVYTESRSACTEPRSANQNLRLGSAFPRCCRSSVRSDVQSSPTFQRFDVQTCQRLDVFCSLPLFPCRPTPTPHYPPKLLRINTYKSLSKQRTLTLRRIYTYKKDGGWEGGMVNQLPPVFQCSNALTTVLCSQSLPHSFIFRILQLLYLPARRGGPLIRKQGGCIPTLPILEHFQQSRCKGPLLSALPLRTQRLCVILFRSSLLNFQL